MRSRKDNIFYGIDRTLVLFYLILIFLGWLNIYATTISISENGDSFSFATEYGKQLIWIALSFVLIMFIFLLESRYFEKYASIIYVITVLSLVGLFVFGKNINGATSWYNLGMTSIQPSEFSKVATALAMAKLLNDKQLNLKKTNTQIQALLLLLIPAILIILQPDPGSALVYGSFIFVLYREGLPVYHFSFGVLSLVLFITTLIFGSNNTIIGAIAVFGFILLYLYLYRSKALKRGWIRMVGAFFISILFIFSVEFVFNNVFEQHHRDRFNILFEKTEDTKSIGYNTNQSITTIASGGFFGKGFLQGERTQGDFVPAQQTDYIFTTVGEQWGFIGSTILVAIFILFILRIIKIAERQKSKFSRVYGYSVAAILFTHFTINIGMVIGILPTIGIPLPFFSYGGSALWGFTVLLFILIRLDANRTYEW
ncbi:rod shape-determining protein RodA [Lutibacter sp.]|uniref:rod shape-determining protein RodA n=1 Tax=Lutibacter sp. TaxID=1925666 RepID=UPI0027340E5E|nr:rod shape-determining protein RodA [Lutibacter sp.]MDP3311740.1 rod shape-determining protein RodA [Lutibacter sp.]